MARIDTSLSMVGALDRRARREGRRPRARRDRHRVRLRAALPGAAVPRPGRRARPGRARRRAHRGDRPARRRPARPGARSRACWPTPTWRWSCTPGARTSRSCGAPGRPRSRASSTRSSLPGSSASATRRATSRWCARCWACASRAPRASPSGTGARSRPAARVRGRRRAPAARARARRSSSRLEERGRLAWAREECRALEESTDERDPDRVFERLPRLGRLGEAARAVARELVEWREDTARALDRPSGYVLPDQALIELARRAPSDRAGLEQIRGLPAADAPPPRRPAAGGDRARPRAPGAAGAAGARARASRPTRRSCRSPRRSCATARWRRAWRSS